MDNERASWIQSHPKKPISTVTCCVVSPQAKHQDIRFALRNPPPALDGFSACDWFCPVPISERTYSNGIPSNRLEAIKGAKKRRGPQRDARRGDDTAM